MVQAMKVRDAIACLGFMLIFHHVNDVKSQESSSSSSNSLTAPPSRFTPRNGTDYADAIAFPENTHNVQVHNTDGRIPLYLPTKCPDNQLLYPGNQESDWICDCAPGYIYVPDSDKCFGAYQRGPCNFGSYLVLSSDEIIPKCVKNPCVHDDRVLYHDSCWPLNKEGGPCPKYEEGGGILGINATTLELECIKSNLPILTEAAPPLPKQKGCFYNHGSKRNVIKSQQGGCKHKREA